jgi:uncharacterized protein YfdQ (DUF2303 family)
MNDPKKLETTLPAPHTAQLLLDTGRRLNLEARMHPHERGMPFVVLRDKDGNELLEFFDFESMRNIPWYKQGIVPAQDIASFVRYFNDHATHTSRVYASLSPVRFTGVLNDHGKAEPAWRDHRVVYTPDLSPEYKTWQGKNGHQFKGNVEWAEWLEDQVPDITQPSGAEMMEIALNFRVNDSVAFSNPTRLQNGRTEFTFNRIVDGHAQGAAGKIAIPEEFAISIPVWAGLNQAQHSFQARLRYRLRDAGLLIWYQLVRPHKVLERAVADLVSVVEGEIGTAILFGAPE